MPEHETIAITRATAGDAAAAPPPLIIPRQLGSVRLIRQIGQGGMGVVWLGHDEMLGRKVAVKFLLGALADPGDPNFATFIEGARAAAAIPHPGLSAVHQADLVEGFPYLVMEFIEGPTLAQVLLKLGPLPLAEAVPIIDATCDPIHELHDRQIIHRDIKPANVMLAPGGKVVVTDFGLTCARAFGSSTPSPGSGIAGTPAYMPPEMFDGVISVRADVYALGAMLYELLTDEVPHNGPIETMAARKRSEPLALAPLHAREVPQEVVDVVERALHPDVLYRYKSSRHLQRALRDALPDARVLDAATSALSRLLERYSGSDASDPTPAAGDRGDATYYDQLSSLAKRRQRADEPSEGAEPLAGPTPGARIDLDASAHRRVRLGALATLGSGGVAAAAVLLDVPGALAGSPPPDASIGVSFRLFADAFGAIGGVGLFAAALALASCQAIFAHAPRVTLLASAIPLLGLFLAGASAGFAPYRPVDLAGGIVAGVASALLAGAAAWAWIDFARRSCDKPIHVASLSLVASAGAAALFIPISLASLVSNPREAAVLQVLNLAARVALAGSWVALGLSLHAWIRRASHK